MLASATIFELDQFRRLRDALQDVGRQKERASEVRRAADWYLPGFIGKARVSTAFGELPIEALRLRDELRTFTGVSASVQAIDKIHLDQEFLQTRAFALPIRIPMNAFGPGRPSAGFLVSPGQEICADTHVASSFSPAKTLSSQFTLDLSLATGLTYYRFHCGAPTIIRVEGIWVRVQPWTDKAKA
jgi:hypothetical protein